MAKINSPLLSMGAAGQIGKAFVIADWRGITYARKYAIPANPQSTEQVKTRSLFSWLNAVYKLFNADSVAPWNANATSRPYTGRNKFLSENVSAMRGDTDETDYVGSPGANGGLALAAFTPSGGASEVTTSVTFPDLPTGWTAVAVVAQAILDQDPQTETSYASYTDKQTSAPWAGTISGLAAGDYWVTGWAVMTKADGTTAYGPAATPTKVTVS